MATRPNILLITNDQHRFDFFGDTGRAPSLQTPALDQLRRDGAVLENMFSNCPICMPARFSWCHGLYPSQAARGLLRNNADWPTDLPTMPQALQRAGYHTAVIGKVHAHAGLEHVDLVEREPELLARGYHEACEVSGKSLAYWRRCRWTDHLEQRGLLEAYREQLERRCVQLGGHERYEAGILEPDDFVDGFIGQQSLQWLDRYDHPKPFYLHVSFCGPHFPLDPPHEFFRRHHPENMPEPIGSHSPDWIRRCTQHRAMHLGMIELIDQQIGQLMDQLRSAGLDDNTVVLFVTDHGDMLGDLGLEHKSQPYDGSCRTPLAIRWPGVIPAGQRLDTMAESVDLPATLLHIAGCQGPTSRWLPQSPGRSFLPCVTGQTDQHRPWAYAEVETFMAPSDASANQTVPVRWRMCCEPGWKYIRHHDGRDELYDRRNDPTETSNLADQPEQHDRIARMRGQLIDSMSACVAPDRPQAPQPAADMLPG